MGFLCEQEQVSPHMRRKPPDLSALSLCSIFDAEACELWMVLIEKNTVFNNTAAELKRGRALREIQGAAPPGSKHTDDSYYVGVKKELGSQRHCWLGGYRARGVTVKFRTF